MVDEMINNMEQVISVLLCKLISCQYNKIVLQESKKKYVVGLESMDLCNNMFMGPRMHYYYHERVIL